MSAAAVEESDDTMMFCASCGVAGGDDIKLKKCTACYLVRYCSIKCQKEHRQKHKKECKKRVAELHDEILFKQPEGSYNGDCPICYLPLPVVQEKSSFMSCCSKSVCNGCDYANTEREKEGRLPHKCPFCRKAAPKTEEEVNERLMKRIDANDPGAMCVMGTMRYEEGDYKAAFEFWTRAVALGYVEAHHQLSVLYQKGQGVEKDMKKELHHLKEAAIGGHPAARHNLGARSYQKGRVDRAVKHLIIAAKLGHDKSLKSVQDLYKAGFVSKEDFNAALRGYQAAIAAQKSPQRDEAEKWKTERETEAS